MLWTDRPSQAVHAVVVEYVDGSRSGSLLNVHGTPPLRCSVWLYLNPTFALQCQAILNIEYLVAASFLRRSFSSQVCSPMQRS